jgi:TolB-like protein/Tfp pilus assembly protein PilF
LSFFRELKRRNVFKVGIAYVIVAWLLLQVSDTLVPALYLPNWFHSGVAFLLILGFPIALIFAWAYEITPEGLKKDKDVDHSQPRTGAANNKPYFTIIGLLVVSLTMMTLWPIADWDSPFSQTDSKQPYSDGPSIAVLSFINDSGDSDQDYFSSGLTDDIITELSKYTELVVFARAPTLEYDSRSLDVSDLGAKFNARYILQGSVRKAGDRIRVSVQLSDALKSKLMWGNNYQRDLTASDLFSLQDELTQQVVSAIAGSYGALARAELADARRKPPKYLSSYNCVLRTFEYLHAHDPSHHLKARDCLEGVVELDPDYADGWAWLAYLYADEYHHRRNEHPDAYDSRDRALEVAERAISLDPANQVSYGALAIASILRGDHERGKIAAYKAIELNPNNALWLELLGTWLSCIGDFEHGLPMVKKALVLDPNPPPWLHMSIFLEYYHNGQYEAALAEAQMIETGDFRAPTFLAAVNGQLGHVFEAERAFSELRLHSQGSFDDINQELIQRNGFAPELAGQIVEGLRKAGVEDSSN